MPAEKGIPKPEASARRLDVRNYDSREAWGWLSDDECLITQQEFLLCSQKNKPGSNENICHKTSAKQ